MNNNPIGLNDPLGDVVKYEHETDVTTKELRHMKREIRQMRRNSDSFNKMYKDMRKSKDMFVFKASGSVDGGNTAKPWDQGQDGVTTMSVNVRMGRDKRIETLAHETGHGWRIAQKLDEEPHLLDIPNMPGVLGTKQDWKAYNKNNDFVRGQNLLNSTTAREQSEVGAMHIGNIVVSELKASGNDSYVNLSTQPTYFGPTAIPGISLLGNPTYSPGYKDYKIKVSEDYYNTRIDIHKEHNVNPIKE